ncbi:MAG TPA: hypothetical protein PKZ83_17235 [bacterium]|nr:hypothetical protein [bacterium]HQJ66311.1 hypothetical protein [bacterium]
MNEEVDRLLNQPREFKIGNKTLTVEALPPGAVTLIIMRIIDKIKTVDLEMLKNAVADGKAESIYDLFGTRLVEAMARDYQIFQMILTPAETWRRTRGKLKKTDFPVTIEELEWDAPELMLGEILDEWLARNPRFAIQKKMVNLAAMQQ